MSLLRHVTNTEGGHYGYTFFCPGCSDSHTIPTKPHERGWDFDGNDAAPTFAPSILIDETKAGPNASLVPPGTVLNPRCHSFVRGGKIQFLSDCGHGLAGQTVPLPEIADGHG